eukprot:m.36780 g.36780  ORF g.36780 m.36780 type:complete len:499 (+) comp7613_c0_seq1:184-1680(+)
MNEHQPLLGRGGQLSQEEIDAASYYHQYATAGDTYEDIITAPQPKIHPDGDPLRKASLWTAIFHSWNATIGVGLLALPRAFAGVGWVTATIALVIFSVLCLATFAMLATAMRACNEFTFGGLMRATAGPWTAEATDVIIFLFLYGVQVVYTQVVAAIMVDMLGDWNTLPVNDDDWFDNRRFFVVAFGFGLFWPLCLFPKLHFLKHVSLLSTVAMVYVVVVLVYRMFGELHTSVPDSPCVLPGLNLTVNGATCAEPVVADASFMDYASALSTFSFALTTHTSIPPIVSELDRPTHGRVNKLIHALVWFSFALYLIAGVCGYLLFGSRQCPLVTNAFSEDDRLMQAGQMAVVLSVTGGYPIQTFQARVSFDRMIRIDRWLLPDRTDNGGVCFDLFSRDTARKMLSSTLLVWTSVGIAFFVSDLDAVIDLTGAVGGGATAFILPCVAYVYCAPQDARTLRWVWVVLGTALVIFLTAVTCYSIALTELDTEEVNEQTCGRNL